MEAQLTLGFEEAPITSLAGRPAPTSIRNTSTALALENLTDVELLSRILVNHGGAGAAELILCDYDGIGPASAASRYDFVDRTGLGPEVHDMLLLAQELGLRVARHTFARKSLTTFNTCLEYLKARMAHLGSEQVRVLYLDNRNGLIEDRVMWSGTINHAIVYPREIAKVALLLDANAVIMAHNHPSGDPTPSRADIEMTDQVVKALEPLKISLHDHIVIGREGHVSMKSKGLF